MQAGEIGGTRALTVQGRTGWVAAVFVIVAARDTLRCPGECREMTEKQLLERFIAENDQAAFRTLVELHGPMVLGVCRSVLNESHDAEDAFQNTFLALVQNASTIRNRDSLGPWLHRVALRIARRARVRAGDRRARERRGSRSEADAPRVDSGFGSPEVLHEELKRLPDRYRLPLVLCYLEGKTNAQAAEQLQWPVGTVKGRLWRARGQLRDQLCRRGLIPSEGLQDLSH
jgi:RNA polymerase sigma factor (sigma-70 family)